MTDKIQKIDIRALFIEKNPGFAKMIPGFIYRFISKVLRLKEINEIIEKYGQKRGMEFVKNVIDYFNVSQKTIGLENIPKNGRFIFASNHPIGGFDALLLMENVYKEKGDFRFIVNDVLMKIPQLKDLFLPINKYGKNNKKYAQLLEKQYKSDLQILIFPSGLASRKVKGTVKDTSWRPHFIKKSIQYQRDIIPVHISGRNSNLFYSLANIRKFIHLKSNIESFLLPNESFRQRNKELTLSFGKPIPYTTFTKEKSLKEWTKTVKEISYNLPLS